VVSQKLEALGFGLPRLQRCLLLLVDDLSQLPATESALAALQKSHPGIPLAFAAPGRAGKRHLRRRFPSDIVVTWPQPLGVRRFLRALRPVAALHVAAGTEEPATLRRLRRCGLYVERTEGDSPAALDRVAARLPSLPDSRKSREGWRRSRPLRRLWQAGIPRLAVRCFGPPCIEDWEELREALGRPEAILCLGNGPSAEDPALTATSYDSLFRVNHRWTGRGFLDEPDLIVAGAPQTPRYVAAPVLVFRSVAEARLAAWQSLRRLRRPSFRPLALQQVDPALEGADFGARPSSGALMVAAAVALHPRRIAVAGLDLFQHPAGRYVGDAEGMNAYAPVHQRDAELSYLRWVLAGFRGELELHGPVLAAALQRTPLKEPR
jgi:hypothetical protein